MLGSRPFPSKCSPRAAWPGRAPGFVLVAALATVMIGAIWSASAAQRLILSAGSGRAVAENARQREIASDGLASVIYLAVTSPRSSCGWQPEAAFVTSDLTSGEPDREAPCLKLDGRPTMLSGARVELQDWNGLISVRIARPDLINAMALAEAPAPATFSFAGSLQDFGDINTDRRMLGAEAAEYAERSRPPPANRWPQTPYEAFDALGWDALQATDIADYLGIGLGVGLNINTAPAQVLMRMDPFNDDLARKIIAGREAFAIEGSRQLAELTDGLTDKDPFAFNYLAAAHVRVRVGGANAPPALEASILASSGDSLPLWLLDYQMPIPKKAIDDTLNRSDDRLPTERADRDVQWLRSRP
jgi:hypothetical protein